MSFVARRRKGPLNSYVKIGYVISSLKLHSPLL